MPLYLEDWVHAGIFGSTGTGKSTLGEFLCEIARINQNMKIIDLTNALYLETIGFLSPTKIESFISFMKNELGSKIEPKAFPTEIYIPLSFSIPSHLPDIIKPFSLSLDFFTYENVVKVLTSNSLSDASYTSLSQEISRIKSGESLPAVPMKIYETVQGRILTLMKHGVPFHFYSSAESSLSSALRPIIKASDVGIFTSEKFEYVFDDKKFKEIIKDRQTITGFSSRWIDTQYNKLKLAIDYYLLTKLRELVKEVNVPTIIYIREARKLFPNSRATDPALKVLSELAEDMVKDCRKAGIHLILDTQSPFDLPEGVLDQLSLRFIFRHDRREADLLEMYQGSPSLDKERIKRIKLLKDFHFYISSTDYSISSNKLKGLSLDFKLSNHLEERQNELHQLLEVIPKERWFKTNDLIEALRQNWMETAIKYDAKAGLIKQLQNERITAKKLGLSPTEFRILKFIHRESGEDFITFKDLRNSLGMQKGTAEGGITGLFYKGFINRNDDGESKLSDRGYKFVENNVEDFT